VFVGVCLWVCVCLCVVCVWVCVVCVWVCVCVLCVWVCFFVCVCKEETLIGVIRFQAYDLSTSVCVCVCVGGGEWGSNLTIYVKMARVRLPHTSDSWFVP
jgi:hypothetical protein